MSNDGYELPLIDLTTNADGKARFTQGKRDRALHESTSPPRRASLLAFCRRRRAGGRMRRATDSNVLKKWFDLICDLIIQCFFSLRLGLQSRVMVCRNTFIPNHNHSWICPARKWEWSSCWIDVSEWVDESDQFGVEVNFLPDHELDSLSLQENS